MTSGFLVLHLEAVLLLSSTLFSPLEKKLCGCYHSEVWWKHVLHHPYHSNPSAAPLFTNHPQGEQITQQRAVISQGKSLKMTW